MINSNIQYSPSSTAHISNVALASANVKRWNLESLGGRLMDIVRNNLCTCLRPWTPKIKENISRAKKMMFANQDDVKFTKRCKERVSTNLHSLRMIMNDAEMESRGRGAQTVIPEDIYVLARDVIVQSNQFIEMCDKFLTLCETLSKGTPTKIHRTLTPRISASRELRSALMMTSSSPEKLRLNTSSEMILMKEDVGSRYLDLVKNSHHHHQLSSSSTQDNMSTPSKKTFADTSNPREMFSTKRRAATPNTNSSSTTTPKGRGTGRTTPKPVKIPDFHNDHIPVEVYVLPSSSSSPNRRNDNNERNENNDHLLILRLSSSSSPTPSSSPYGHGHREYSQRKIEQELANNDQYADDNNNHELAKNGGSITQNRKCKAPDPRIGDHLVHETNRLSPRQRSTIERAVRSMIGARPELSDEDRLWLVASLRRLKIDDELSNPY